MRWGRRRKQISPEKNQEELREKQVSFLSCLLSKLLCISNPCLGSKVSNQESPKPQSPKHDPNPETTDPISKDPPQSQTRSVQRTFDITKRPKIGYKPPSYHRPAVIYGLDPMVQSRRNKGVKVTKLEEKDLEGFAVAKKSSNPESDFKESMVRMIRLKHISRPEDLENLLACYLVLNSDEYHDVIVKVFRQVWVEITSARLRSSRRPVRANRRV